MHKYITPDQWKIIENHFEPANHEVSESLFSIGNGRIGQRGMFEETYSGRSLQGSYLAGVYYPDKTRVGWWKIGYPEYFAKVLNAVDWKSLILIVNGQEIDLAKIQPDKFQRILDMRNGLLQRSFRVSLENGVILDIETTRFCSMLQRDIAALQYRIKVIKGNPKVSLTSLLNAMIYNKDANYDELFWENFQALVDDKRAFVSASTKKTNFRIFAGMQNNLSNQQGARIQGEVIKKNESCVVKKFEFHALEGDTYVLEKYVAITTSFFYGASDLESICKLALHQAVESGFSELHSGQATWWHQKWDEADINIIGDEEAQQGVRYNIFQLHQTYTGEHPNLNIGPKGFTGEKYGGSTYWDTEAYCIPFYLATAAPAISRNLLMYRYNQLQKAIENGEKLGFMGGAALYPMVTMNGEECHNEWEITFEEIHRNGAIAYAIFDYTNYTGDESYLLEQGLEVLIGIARFWKQRIHFSEEKQQFVMLGVTGPNEYENNVNNNWYTNYLAVWCLKYCQYWLAVKKNRDAVGYSALVLKLSLSEEEISSWDPIIHNMYLPYDDERRIFLQQDGYLDKEQKLVKDLPSEDLPLNQKWSWDRILRSCFIKQADVLQGLYFFEDDFDTDIHRRNFEFYEPRTVHESSLSPCIHAILAAHIGDHAKAYEMYMRTARLDLDNYNNDTEDGLHITSMAGTWMAIVKGFGGMRVRKGVLHLNPTLPQGWESYKFSINFRGALLKIFVNQESVIIDNYSDKLMTIKVYNEDIRIDSKDIFRLVKKSYYA